MFDPIRSYDKPAVIISQLANGIASTGSVTRALFDPAALSPAERESFVDDLKAEYGGNAVADTALGVFTNPLVWLGLLTVGGGAAGARNIAAGKRFFAGTPGVAGKALFPFLQTIKMASGAVTSIGRRIGPLAQTGIMVNQKVVRDLASKMDGEVTRLVSFLEAKHNVKIKSLDPNEAPNAAVAKDLRDIRGVNQVRRLQWDRDRDEEVLVGVEADRHHVRIHVGKDSRGVDQYVIKEVTPEIFNRIWNRNQNRSENHSVTDVSDSQILLSLPGLDPGDATLLDSMNRLGKTDVMVKLGVDQSKMDLDRSLDRDGTLSPKSPLEGGPRARWEVLNRKKYFADEAEMQAVDDEFNLQQFRAAEDKLYEYGKVLLAGDEAAYADGRGFVLDREKVLKTVRSKLALLTKAGYLDKNGYIKGNGEEQVAALFSDEVASLMMGLARRRTAGSERGAPPLGARVGSTKDEIENFIVDTLAKGYEDPRYIPRNTVEAFDPTGRRIAYNPYTNKRVQEVQGDDPEPSGRTIARTRTTEVPWDPGDLDYLIGRFGGTDDAIALRDAQFERVQGQIQKSGFYRVMRIAPDVAADKYITSIARDYTFFSHNAQRNAAVRSIIEDIPVEYANATPGVANENARRRLPGPLGASEQGAEWTVRNLDDIPDAQRPSGGYSLWDLMDTELRNIGEDSPGDSYVVGLWREHILPGIMGIRPLDDASHIASAGVIHEASRRLANSRLFRAIEARGGAGGRFVTDLRRWATDSTGLEFNPLNNVTKALYVSHMGLNPGTVLINLLQPLQSIHHLGFKNTVEAYGQAFDMFASYAKARMALGPGATRADIEKAFRTSFTRRFGGVDVDMEQIADIGNTWEMLDKNGYGVRQRGKNKFSFLEMMMMPFQVSETLNRTVTANAVMNAYQRAGRVSARDAVRAKMDAASAVQQFQFGTNPINRPAMFFMPVLREPAFRQFAQYGLRSFANLFTVPTMVGGTRSFAGKEVTSNLGVRLVDITRMLAVSAVTYEVAKNAVGMDLSRGLALGMTDLVGGQNAFSSDAAPMYVPPVVDLGFQAAKYLATQDAEILQDLVPRTIPSGIALSRALGSFGPSETLQAIGLQKTFVDWSQAQGGMAPVFKSDGRFMGQVPTSDIVLKALGADMGRFNQPQEMSQFLLKNRDAIREERRRYIAAVLGNNMSAASSVKAQFEKRFGLPLTVTQQQMKEAIKLREKSIVERTLGTMDVTVRDMYQRAVQEHLPGQLMGAEVPGPFEQGDMYRWTDNVKAKSRAGGGGQGGSGRQQEPSGG